MLTGYGPVAPVVIRTLPAVIVLNKLPDVPSLITLPEIPDGFVMVTGYLTQVNPVPSPALHRYVIDGHFAGPGRTAGSAQEYAMGSTVQPGHEKLIMD
ncbi:MAG: hypothetical protein CVV33_03700 [Methanomicrobiales archaeon HGW-Methanomicrobiales-4]|nr:MAG: hypothetical protein CVV33_03700 [Methanomicrobiales archaeon HGW-Methanomicrobiales-4]